MILGLPYLADIWDVSRKRQNLSWNSSEFDVVCKLTLEKAVTASFSFPFRKTVVSSDPHLYMGIGGMVILLWTPKPGEAGVFDA